MAPEKDNAIRTRDEAEAAMALLAALQVQLDGTIETQKAKLLQAREHDAAIADLQQRVARQHARLESWAGAHREQFGEAKSLDLRHGRLGFRSLGRAVKLLEGWTETTVLAKLRKLGNSFERYIRVKHELNRWQILQDTRPEVAQLPEKELKKFGVQITREEKFFIEPWPEGRPVAA